MDILEELEQQHLTLLSDHPRYQANLSENSSIDYSDVIKWRYAYFYTATRSELHDVGHLIAHARNDLANDIKAIYKKTEIHLSLSKFIKSVVKGTDQTWSFVTLGFDDKVVKPVDMRSICERIKKTYDVVAYVHELHRKDDKGKIFKHHHTHYLIRTDQAKSTIVKKIWGFAGIKKMMANKEKIDVKNYKDGPYERYEKYISGDKVFEKLECIELDKKWRLENNL